MKNKCKSSTQTKKIYAYGSTRPLKVAGTFWSKVSHGDKMFLVIEGQGKPLLCRDTTIKLGLLKIGPSFVNLLDNQSMTKD